MGMHGRAQNIPNNNSNNLAYGKKSNFLNAVQAFVALSSVCQWHQKGKRGKSFFFVFIFFISGSFLYFRLFYPRLDTCWIGSLYERGLWLKLQMFLLLECAHRSSSFSVRQKKKARQIQNGCHSFGLALILSECRLLPMPKI